MKLMNKVNSALGAIKPVFSAEEFYTRLGQTNDKTFHDLAGLSSKAIGLDADYLYDKDDDVNPIVEDALQAQQQIENAEVTAEIASEVPQASDIE